MWLILTIIFAVLTYASVLYFDSLIPALFFLGAALMFLGLMWNRRLRKK
jgi:hypothetical protein